MSRLLDRYSIISDMVAWGDLSKIPERMVNMFKDDESLDRTYFIEQLKFYGCQILGTGMYSIVISHPNRDGAIKLVYNRRDKWVEYAKFALDHHESNPMLPKVFELYELGGWCVSRMELLEDAQIDHSVGMWNVVKAVRSPMFGVMNMTRKRKRQRISYYLNSWFDLRWMGGYSHTHLADIVLWLAGKGTKVTIDCHGANWMRRNSQLVLTDPIH